MVARLVARWNPFGGDRWNWGNFFFSVALWMAASALG